MGSSTRLGNAAHLGASEHLAGEGIAKKALIVLLLDFCRSSLKEFDVGASLAVELNERSVGVHLLHSLFAVLNNSRLALL